VCTEEPASQGYPEEAEDEYGGATGEHVYVQSKSARGR
jgi:hypothetical protein